MQKRWSTERWWRRASGPPWISGLTSPCTPSYRSTVNCEPSSTWHPKAGGKTIHSEIHKFIHSVRNKEELPDAWKESFLLPIHKKSDKTDCSNYRSISLLSTTYKILSNVLLSSLTAHVEEIIGDHQRGFWHKSTTDLSYTWEKMGTQWSSASAIYRLPESLWFS